MAAPPPDSARLQALVRKPRAARRLVLLPGTAGAEALAVLAALGTAGYAVAPLPNDAADLGGRLRTVEGEAVMLNDYSAFHATLPATLRDAVAARWGAAERDPHFHPGRVDCGRFVVPALRLGAVVVIATDDGPEEPPRHFALARWAWIVDGFRADAAIAWRAPGVALPLPVLVPAAGAAIDVAALVAALDGDAAALRKWRVI